VSEAPALEWEGRINLFTDPFTLLDLVRVAAISTVIMWTSVALMGLLVSGELVILPPVVLVVLIPIFLVLYLLAALLLGVSVPTTFTVDERGVGWQTGRRASWLSRATIVLGAVAGDPGTAGAGMLGMARESGLVPWERVAHVRPYPDRRVIALADGWHTLLRLYCTAETYDAALALSQRHAAGDAAVQSKPFRRPGRRDVSAFGLALVSAVGIASWQWSLDSARDATVLALGVIAVLASAFLRAGMRRAMGLVGLVSAAYLGVRIAIEAFDPITMISTNEVIGYGWELDTPLLVIAVSGVCVLFALCGLLLLGRREQL